MNVRKKLLVAFAALTSTVAMFGSASAQAEQPTTVCRVFGMFYGSDSDPDLQGAGSIALISHAPQETSSIHFRTHEDNQPILSGMFLTGGDGTLVSIGGASAETLYWLDNEDGSSNLPPVGARTTTGPGGDVTVIGKYFVTETTDGCGSNCGWRIIGVDDGGEPPLGWDSRFCLAIGEFSK